VPVSAEKLEPNQPRHFYRGGAAIAELRGIPPLDGHRPEDWLGSTTRMLGREVDGLTRLADGRLLKDAVQNDPEGWLGPEHVADFGADTALLVKLLDAGERLPVHCHPDAEFARHHLGSRHGKTEAWVVLGTAADDSAVHLGFRHEVAESTLADLVATQDAGALLGALNVVPVDPGDVVFVPAGVPHALDAGVFILELQEPTDFSVLLERAGFELGEGAAPELGLGDAVALGCVDRSAWGPERLRTVHLRRRPPDAERASLLPVAAAPFFRAERWRCEESVELGDGFAVLVVVAGEGKFETESRGRLAVARGDAVIVPYDAGSVRLSGRLEVIRCRPPFPHPGAVHP